MRAPKRHPSGTRAGDLPGSVLKYRAQGKTLDEFHKQPEFVRGVIGPLGSGKTFAAIFEILMQCHNQVPNRDGVRRSRWCVARNSFPDLNSATIPDFRSVTDNLPFGDFTMGAPPKWEAKYKRKDGTYVEIQVMFRSFDGEQDVKKARGMQLTGIWVDELAEFHKANFDILIGRVKRFPPKAEAPKANFECLFTSNACPRDHWLAELALRNTPPDWWIGIQPPGLLRKGNAWVENPNAENRQNLADRYYIAQCGGKKESWIRQNLVNEFVHHSDGRPVHPDFNEQLHVQDLEPAPGLPLHLGTDWGRTPACAIMQRQPNGRWHVLEEVCLVNAGADKLGKAVKRVLNARYRGYTVEEATGDPSGGDFTQAEDHTPIDLFNENSGLFLSGAHTNDPEIRIATLDNLLTTLIDGQPALLVDRGCHTLVAGLAGKYQFRRVQVTGQDKFHDKPDKGPESHVCEALHYGLMGAGESETLFNQNYESMMEELGDFRPPDSVFE